MTTPRLTPKNFENLLQCLACWFGSHDWFYFCSCRLKECRRCGKRLRDMESVRRWPCLYAIEHEERARLARIRINGEAAES